MCWSMARWRWMTTAAQACWLGRRCRREGHDQVGMVHGNAARTVVRVNDGGVPVWPGSPSGGIDITTVPKGYDPGEFRALTFHGAVPQFRDGPDTPRAYLEPCLETIAERQALGQALAALNLTAAPQP